MIDSVPEKMLKLGGRTMELPRRKFLHAAAGQAGIGCHDVGAISGITQNRYFSC
jgi:hypothetical protein